MGKDNTITIKDQRTPVEMLPGITRRTMSYNDSSMLCHFVFEKGAKIPLHKHEAVQNGYVLSGKVRFFKIVDGKEVATLMEAGSGYLFESNQEHGAECLEESELIECFTPMRPEYGEE